MQQDFSVRVFELGPQSRRQKKHVCTYTFGGDLGWGWLGWAGQALRCSFPFSYGFRLLNGVTCAGTACMRGFGCHLDESECLVSEACLQQMQHSLQLQHRPLGGCMGTWLQRGVIMVCA